MIDHLSYSQVAHYLSCQRSYRYKYVNEIPTAANDALLFGSAWHKMISKCLVDGGHTPLDEIWSGACAENPDVMPDELFELGLKMVSSHLVTLQKLSAYDEMIDHYIEFSIPNVPVPIIGYIDMVADDRVPVDFKTASRKWTQAQADQSLQPTFYLAGLHYQGFLKASDFPAKFRYIIFTKTKTPDVQILETTRTASDIINMFTLVEACWQAIKNGTFLPTGAGSWRCSENYCDFWERCMGGIKDEIRKTIPT